MKLPESTVRAKSDSPADSLAVLTGLEDPPGGGRCFRPGHDARKRFAGVLLALGLAVGSAAAQRATFVDRPVLFRHLTTGDGLSQGTVHRILQDRQGFMWFATDDGLNRFDGYNFKTYRAAVDTPGSLESSVVFDIAEDYRGRLWVGTWGGGLSLFDQRAERFTVYRAESGNPRSLSDDRVNCLLPDPDGGIWVGTEGGLNLFHPETGHVTQYHGTPGDPASLSGEWIRSLYIDGEGVLWVGTDAGLNRFDRLRRSFARFRHDPGDPASLPHDQVLGMTGDGAGRLWVFTTAGVCRLDGAAGKFNRIADDGHPLVPLAGIPVRDILRDRSGVTWFGTAQGLYRLAPDSRRLERFTHDPDDPATLVGDSVIALCQDRSGVLWVGTLGQGGSTYQPGRQKFVPVRSREDGTTLSEVFGVLIEGRRIWLGTRAGLRSFDLPGAGKPDSGNLAGDFAQAFPACRDALEGRLTSVLFRDRGGTLWLAVRDFGLFRLSPDRSASALYRELMVGRDPVPVTQVLDLYEDQAGILWLGTDGFGLVRWDLRSGRIDAFRHDPRDHRSLGSDYVTKILEGADGTLWVGTWGGGVNLMDRAAGRFHRLVHQPGNLRSLSHNIVNTAFLDSRGTIWVGTYGGGLNRYDQARGEFARFTVREGLANDVVCGILEDGRGDLWVSTYSGLSRLERSTGRFTNYTSADGLQADEFNIRAQARSRDGWLVFGGTRGFNAFRPEEIGVNAFIPPVVFTGYQRFVYGGGTEVRGFLGAGDIELSYRDSVTLAFAALDYTNPAKNRFAYRLEGGYTDWVQLGTRHEITFANLSPGSYTLRVRGSNDEGKWNERGTSVAIVVHPPFYQTWWFRLALAAVAAALLYCGYRAWATRHR